MIVMIAAMPAFATPMDDYIAFVNETCEKLTQEKERLTRLAYQKGAKATEDTAERMARVSSSVVQAQKLIGEKPPQAPAEQEALVRKLNDLINSANMEVKTAQRRLGVTEFGLIDVNWQDCMTKISKCFDGSIKSVTPTPAEIDIPRLPDTDFFLIRKCKDDANRRAAAGAAEISQCGVCPPRVIEQHLKELQGYLQRDIDACERGPSRK